MQDFASFADMVRPHDLESVHSMCEPRHLPNPDRGRFIGMLEWPEIEVLLTAERLLAGTSMLLRNGVTVPPGSLLRRGANGRQSLVPAALHELAMKGVSIVLNNVNQDMPRIDTLGACIERHFGMDVHANAYISFGSQGALKPHWDSHHVVVLQLCGTKVWSFFGSSYPLPIEGLEAPAGETVSALRASCRNIELNPGDLLFVPRGEIHCAKPVDGVSIHLTFGLTPYRAKDVLAWMVRRDEPQDMQLRRGLAPMDADASEDTTDQSLRAAICRLADRIDLTEFAQAMARERPLLRALNLASLQPITSQSLIRSACRRPSPPDDNGVVRAGGRQFMLPPDQAAAFARIDVAGACALADLGNVTSNPVATVGKLAAQGLVIVM